MIDTLKQIRYNILHLLIEIQHQVEIQDLIHIKMTEEEIFYGWSKAYIDKYTDTLQHIGRYTA